MRRFAALAITLMLILTLALNVSAASSATKVASVASVNADESCNVTLTVSIHLDQPVEKLYFPVPRDATSVTLNGSRVGTSQSGDSRLVDLSKVAGSVAGDFTFVITYRLTDVIQANEEGFLELQLPLLAGFDYPVQQLEFTVTLPGEVTAKPAFSSGYHHANIEQDLYFNVDGVTVIGASQKELKDRETLSMTLSVTDVMFPQSVIVLQDYDLFYTLMIICAAVALVYWLLFLRNAPPRFMTAAAPADGYSAGQLGSITRLQGADLTMMVFSWAQLGYILMKMDKRGHVTLYKRMEMGNERSTFEQKCFKNLFGKRSQVDTSGYHYASMYQKVKKLPPNIHPLVNPKSGSVFLFRALAGLMGLFGGICLGMALGADAAARGFIIFLLAAFGGISSWFIHPWADDLFRFGKWKLITSIVLCVIWIVLSILAELFNVLIWVVLAQLLVGLMASFGGRRTPAGRQALNETFGLYWYLRGLSQKELLFICRQNPEYFHTMAPYALAMGVDKVFANRFGKLRLPECPYLVTGQDADLTAAQWSQRMRRAANAIDARRRQLPLEKIMGIIQSFRR